MRRASSPATGCRMTDGPERAAEPVSVQLWGTLRDLLGRDRVEVRARTIREMLDGLAEAHPGLKPQLESGVSVSIDGAIYNGSWFKRIEPGQEIVLLPRIKGG